jgi:hypothetical protein
LWKIRTVFKSLCTKAKTAHLTLFAPLERPRAVRTISGTFRILTLAQTGWSFRIFTGKPSFRKPSAGKRLILGCKTPSASIKTLCSKGTLLIPERNLKPHRTTTPRAYIVGRAGKRTQHSALRSCHRRRLSFLKTSRKYLALLQAIA